jgi:transposase
MKAYTQELRERIVAAVDHGVPRDEVAEVFGVGLSTIKRYLKQRRETGSVAPKPIPGRPPKKLGPLREGLSQQLGAVPDATLGQRCQLWEQSHGERVSQASMCRTIKRLGWTRKKRLWEPPKGMKPPAAAGESR